MPTPGRGLLIAFEGIDGAGKTTQAALLEKHLALAGHPVVRSKEPTDGPWGQRLRDSARTGRLPPEEELRLFLEDRREHVAKKIRPALARGSIVIIDRYYFSTVAYQGARGLDPKDLLAMNEDFAPRPDLLIVLDVEPAEGLRRVRRRDQHENLFEEERALTAAASIFRMMDFSYMIRINGTLPAEDIAAGILERLYSGPLSTVQKSPDLQPEDRDRPNGDWWGLAAGGKLRA